MKKRVVITGIGPVTSIGIGKNEFWDHLFVNESAIIKPVPIEISKTKSQIYVPFPVFNPTDYGINEYYSFIQPEDKLALVATKLALEDAGYQLKNHDRRFLINEESEISVIIGTGFTGLETAFHSYLSHLGIDYCSSKQQKKVSFNRMVIPLLMNNSPSAWISVFFGLIGESFTVNASCASGTSAIGLAYRKIADGYSQMVVSGAVENLKDESFAIMRGFDALGALTKSKSGTPEAFSEDRSGFLFSEGGACILILEELSHALSRQATIYAEILNYAANSDAHNIVLMDPEGKQIIKLFKELAGSEKIDYLNAHGTATVLNDETEAKTIFSYFGSKEQQPNINSSKGLLGHTIGASGAIETAITALSISNAMIHRNIAKHPMINLNLATDHIYKNIEKAMTVSYGFGGHNAGLLLGKYHG